MSKWVNSLRSKVKKIIPLSKKRRFIEETYEVKDDLGVGSYSVVKRAVHKKTGDLVAIKIYDKARLSIFDKECIKTEVEILKALRHPNIVTLRETYDTHRKLYIVMELMSGGELLDCIQKKKLFPEKEASRMFRQIVSALAFLHSNGIVHRDIKPDNLLLSSESEDAVVKIADFGFAKRIGDGMLHTPCGSPVYSAPEIVREESYDKSVDMWSAGVLLYILLCGFPPFYHPKPDRLFQEIERGVFDFPDPQWASISSSAKELVSLLLKRNPSERLTAQQALEHPWLVAPGEASLTTPVSLKVMNSKDFAEAVNKSVQKAEPFELQSATESPIWKRRQEKRPPHSHTMTSGKCESGKICVDGAEHNMKLRDSCDSDDSTSISKCDFIDDTNSKCSSNEETNSKSDSNEYL
jgi:calcium/calmodulin-dependent protein kinase I